MKSKTINRGSVIRKRPAFGLSLCVYSILFCASIYGLDRDRSISQFHHTAWTAREGAPSQISALAQTTDGYLWIGSAKGLFRFDGVRFEPFVPPTGIDLPSHNIYTLKATNDGGLWVSFRPSGLGFIKDGRITVFTRPEEIPKSPVHCFAQDLDGRIWAGTQKGLALFDGSKWVEIAADWNFEPRSIYNLFVDRKGTLWVATEKGSAFLPSGSRSFQQVSAAVNALALAQAADGRMWIAEDEQPNGDYFVNPITIDAQHPDKETPQIRVMAVDMLFDREGSLWIVNHSGLARIRFPEKLGNSKLDIRDAQLEQFTVQNGLSGDMANHLLEDREGNIWVSTIKGLDRFRYSYITPVSLPTGHHKLTLLAGDDGSVWAGSATVKPLIHISDTNLKVTAKTQFISSLYRDSKGTAWWGGYNGIWRQNNNLIDFFRQPKDKPDDWIWEVIPNNAGGLWASLGDVGLTSFNDGHWTNQPKPAGLLERGPSASFQDSSGRLWLGYTENRVYSWDGDRVQAFSTADGIDIGRIKVIRGRGPQYWFGGELGLAMFNNGRFKTIKVAANEQFGTISGIVETADGALWLNELRGIVYISPDEIRKVAENPDYAITYQLFDFLDNLPGGTQMNFTVSTAIEATDGRLWFATDNGLARIDPSRMTKNTLPPPVSIRSLKTDEKTYSAAEEQTIELPEGTQNLRIDYTALSLSIPERVRFRFRLAGIDKKWNETDSTHPQAFYNNLGPGNYRFQVIACNNDGVWNEEGAVLEFSIAPMFYQTAWFAALCGALIVALGWLIYNRRVKHIKSRLHLQFEQRLAERTRIAQELHDTLLQGVFSASMHLNAVTEQLPETSPLKTKFDQVSQMIGQVMEEGRDTIRGLHSPGNNKTLILENAFAELKRDFDTRGGIDFRVVVHGDTRPVHPIVRDEIYRLGREAIANAFRHSKADKIEVEIEYAPKYFRFSVRDNGCGIDQEILREGREGHLGLIGMRECAERIGGKLRIWSREEGGGTEIELIVPGHIAFKKEPTGNFLNQWKRLFARKTGAQGAAKEQKNERRSN